MEKEVIAAVSLVKSSQYRWKILKTIGDGIKMPSEIAKEVKIRLNHVSMFLKDLKRNGLVECLNEETRKGRLYQLTKLGKDVITKLS
ncbi:MarR family transcriptional regulator [Candidatus Woesearchaeota archaeon]|nr:MarR family transcriptional regulator [Candidatus Woesearchaeota archaeon]